MAGLSRKRASKSLKTNSAGEQTYRAEDLAHDTKAAKSATKGKAKVEMWKRKVRCLVVSLDFCVVSAFVLFSWHALTFDPDRNPRTRQFNSFSPHRPG